MSYISRKSALACSFFLLLTACGGGGGGSSSLSGSNTSSSESTSQSHHQPTSTFSAQQNVQGTDPDQQGQAAVIAANTLPNFGSVPQSSNRGADGISTDAATAVFDGQNVQVTIERLNGSTFVLDTASDVFVRSPFVSDIPGHSSALASYIGELTDTSFYLAYVGVSWANTSDFLSGGYWMRADGLGTTSASFEMGAFVDGPEISGTPPTLPDTGTASYTGPAQGFYHHVYRGNPLVPEGTQEIGEVAGTITLTVDFANNLINGCVGCAHRSQVSGVAIYPNGGTYEFDGTPVGYQVIYGPTTIASDGSFRDSSVRLVNPDHPVTSSSGSWGGQFSNIPDADGDPRLVTGTGGGDYAHENGTHGVWIGAFWGAK